MSVGGEGYLHPLFFIMCKYCEIDDYRGELFPFVEKIDGGHQNFEVCIFDSPEDESHVLEIDGTHTVLRIVIKFCPECGRQL